MKKFSILLLLAWFLVACQSLAIGLFGDYPKNKKGHVQSVATQNISPYKQVTKLRGISKND